MRVTKINTFINILFCLSFLCSDVCATFLQKDDASNSGGALLKTNIQVGDDTRPFFPVSIWQKHMGSMIVEGDIILLQSENPYILPSCLGPLCGYMLLT